MNKLMERIRPYVLVLTEVPGWPDAPVSARVRRALPVVIPCSGMLFLLIWSVSFQAPRIRAQRAALEPLLMLESRISALRIAYSDQQVAETAEKAASATRLLLPDSADAPDFLKSLKKEAGVRGWEGNFIAGEPSDASTPPGALITLLPVRGKLSPAEGNADPFASMLDFLGKLSSAGKRIDLIRLAVRADERRWHLVELNFLLACRSTNEETP